MTEQFPTRSPGKKRHISKWLLTAIIFLLFSISGVLSSYFYFVFNDQQYAFILPGLLYTSTTILVFVLLRIPFTTRNITIYYSLMFCTYLFIWLITLVSSWFGFIFGIITAGTGSMMTFYITNNFILKITYSRNMVFAWGSLAFLLTDIAYWSYPGEGSPVCNFLGIETEPGMLFGEVFLFWHLLVGLTLLYVLRKNLSK